MRSLPVVAGALVLGFALVLFLSSLRPTRTHVHRSPSGELVFALEVPRSWTVMNSTVQGSAVTLEGPLPSGGLGLLSLQSFTYSNHSTVPPGEAPVRIEKDGTTRETWIEGGWRRSLESGPLPGSGGIWQLIGNLQRDDASFNAIASVKGAPPEEDRELLERCLRSMRWIGR